MDPVTHTLIGIGVANAFLRRRLGPEAIPILALASNLPDIDVLVHITTDPTAVMMRRTFGHSLFLLPIGSALLALAFRRRYPRHSRSRLFGTVLLGACLHLFFDLVNSFGVVLLWPFSDWRPELSIIFIIDLALTGLLAAPLLLCIAPRMRARLEPLSRASLGAVALYLLICGAGRMRAEAALGAAAADGGRKADFSYVFPEPLGPHRWRGVVRQGQTYRVHLIHLLPASVELREEIRTRVGEPSVEAVRSTPLGRRLEWFFKAPVWELGERDPPAGGAAGKGAGRAPDEVRVRDLRFTSLVLPRPAVFSYRFRVEWDGRVVPLF